MKTLLFCYTLLAAQLASAQNITIQGKVYQFDDTSGKLYYTRPGVPFNAHRFIKYDLKKSEYTYTITRGKILKDSLTELLFAPDTSSRPVYLAECTALIKFGNILAAKNLPAGKDIILQNDLLMNCVDNVGAASSAEEEKISGYYALTIHGKTLQVTLGRDGRYTAVFPEDTRHMTRETGEWKYNADEVTLEISADRAYNAVLGLSLWEKNSYNFQVLKNHNQYTFQAANATLVKK